MKPAQIDKGWRALALVITPLGHRILKAVERGTYRFDPHERPQGSKTRGRKLRAKR